MKVPHADKKLVDLLTKNYTHLRRQYRLGGFEAEAMCIGKWSVPGDARQFYELQAEGDERGCVGVTFREAIENLYQLILYVEEKKKVIAREQAVLLLRVRCLVYESKDYTLSVPAALGADFIEWADRLDGTADLTRIRAQAEELNGRRFDSQDDGTKVVKDLLLAALFGAHHVYQRHEAAAYDRALSILGKLNYYIDEELPGQHEEPRESYGLMGLAQYLTGRVLSAQGYFTEARHAFRRSAEAYVARVRQKEDLLRREKISHAEFQEKASVTLRRAALVSAFGDGYLSFVVSRITMALEALTLARAVLTQNSGRVYLVYVDLLYWACKRAAHSSDRGVMETVVREMRRCRTIFRRLVPETHYVHRGGLELALSLYYRAKIAARDGDERNAARGYRLGLRLLDEAIRYAAVEHDGRYRNPHLLADASVMRSHFSRLHHRLERDESGPTLDSLNHAERDVERALNAGMGIPQMFCEAIAAQGAVQTDLAIFYKNRDEKKFQQHYDRASGLLHDALRRNKGENMRLEGACYLRLVKLSLLTPPPQIIAHYYFEQWEKIKDRVEHAFCHDIARELAKRIQEGGPLLIIEPKKSMDYNFWKGRLFDFLIDYLLKKIIDAHPGKNYTDKQWGQLITVALQDELGYQKASAYKIKNKHHLVRRLRRLKG